MILVLDNYDSFTYNLVHYIGECGEEVLVARNDEVSLEEINHLNPKKIVISPGPCTPAGLSPTDLTTLGSEQWPAIRHRFISLSAKRAFGRWGTMNGRCD